MNLSKLKEVMWMESEMQILHFSLVGRLLPFFYKVNITYYCNHNSNHYAHQSLQLMLKYKTIRIQFTLFHRVCENVGYTRRERFSDSTRLMTWWLVIIMTRDSWHLSTIIPLSRITVRSFQLYNIMQKFELYQLNILSCEI